MSSTFQFQQFLVRQEAAAMKVGTDGILLGAWASHGSPRRALDIGTGTGLIALMLAQRYAQVEVDAVEIDEEAVAEATTNAADSPFAARVHVHAQAIQDFARAKTAPGYELIVSNPPFFTGGVLTEQEGRAGARHTVKLSHQDLLRVVQQLLLPGGNFCVVLPWLEGLRFQELAASYQLFTRERVEVSGRPGKRPNRLLLRLQQEAGAVQTNSFHIYADATSQTRSPAFSKLTEHFYQ